MKICDFDISKLTNLKSVSLQCAFLETFQCVTLLHVLSTLNAPRLQQVTLVVQHDNRLTDVEEIDDCLAERFKNLELLIVECDGLREEELERARREIQDMFPQMTHRGMLQIRIYQGPFCY